MVTLSSAAAAASDPAAAAAEIAMRDALALEAAAAGDMSTAVAGAMDITWPPAAAAGVTSTKENMGEAAVTSATEATDDLGAKVSKVSPPL